MNNFHFSNANVALRRRRPCQTKILGSAILTRQCAVLAQPAGARLSSQALGDTEEGQKARRWSLEGRSRNFPGLISFNRSEWKIFQGSRVPFFCLCMHAFNKGVLNVFMQLSPRKIKTRLTQSYRLSLQTSQDRQEHLDKWPGQLFC